jgi:hypothetical protein
LTSLPPFLYLPLLWDIHLAATLESRKDSNFTRRDGRNWPLGKEETTCQATMTCLSWPHCSPQVTTAIATSPEPSQKRWPGHPLWLRLFNYACHIPPALMFFLFEPKVHVCTRKMGWRVPCHVINLLSLTFTITCLLYLVYCSNWLDLTRGTSGAWASGLKPQFHCFLRFIISFTNLKLHSSGFHMVSVYRLLFPSLAFLGHPTLRVTNLVTLFQIRLAQESTGCLLSTILTTALQVFNISQ